MPATKSALRCRFLRLSARRRAFWVKPRITHSKRPARSASRTKRDRRFPDSHDLGALEGDFARSTAKTCTERAMLLPGEDRDAPVWSQQRSIVAKARADTGFSWSGGTFDTKRTIPATRTGIEMPHLLPFAIDRHMPAASSSRRATQGKTHTGRYSPSSSISSSISSSNSSSRYFSSISSSPYSSASLRSAMKLGAAPM